MDLHWKPQDQQPRGQTRNIAPLPHEPMSDHFPHLGISTPESNTFTASLANSSFGQFDQPQFIPVSQQQQHQFLYPSAPRSQRPPANQYAVPRVTRYQPQGHGNVLEAYTDRAVFGLPPHGFTTGVAEAGGSQLLAQPGPFGLGISPQQTGPNDTFSNMAHVTELPPQINVRQPTLRNTHMTQLQTQHDLGYLYQDHTSPVSSAPSSPSIAPSDESSYWPTGPESPFLQLPLSSPATSSPFPGQNSPIIGENMSRRDIASSSNYSPSPLGKRTGRDGEEKAEDAQDEGEADDSDNPPVTNETRRKKQKGNVEDAESKVRFACPFCKRGVKVTKNACTGPGFDTIDRLKEHLKRAHYSDFICDRCKKGFKNAGDLQDHRKTLSCTFSCGGDLISKGKLDLIQSELKSRKLSATQKWNKMWKILFGDEPAPDPRPDLISLRVARDEVLRDVQDKMRQRRRSSGDMNTNDRYTSADVSAMLQAAFDQVGVSHGLLSSPAYAVPVMFPRLALPSGASNLTITPDLYDQVHNHGGISSHPPISPSSIFSGPQL